MGKNVTEQQRIAAALESMVDTSDEGTGKKNVTEQQRIASALEAMAEGGGGSGGETPVYVHLKQENNTWQLDGITHEELMALCKAEKCIGALTKSVYESGELTYDIYPLKYYSEYEQGAYFESEIVVENTLHSNLFIVYASGITLTANQYTLTEKT